MLAKDVLRPQREEPLQRDKDDRENQQPEGQPEEIDFKLPQHPVTQIVSQQTS